MILSVETFLAVVLETWQELGMERLTVRDESGNFKTWRTFTVNRLKGI